MQGAETFDKPLHLQVSQASASAVAAVERAGGSVTTVYYNKLGMRALLKPEWFARKERLLPRPARPPAAIAPKCAAFPPLTLFFYSFQIWSQFWHGGRPQWPPSVPRSLSVCLLCLHLCSSRGGWICVDCQFRC